MNEKQQQLLFDKGITNVPSDALCSDNALEESLGMVYDNGEHRVIQRPVVFMTQAPKIIYIHKFDNKERYITIDATQDRNIQWGTRSDQGVYTPAEYPDSHREVVLMQANGNYQVSSIGKTLIIADGNGLHHFLWKEDEYSEVPDIPQPEVEFFLYGKEEYAVHFSRSTEVNLDEDQETLNNLIVGIYSKNKNSINQKKSFCLPFFIRTALELYDGSYTHISNPILMFPSVSSNTGITSVSIVSGVLKSIAGDTYYQKLYYVNNSNIDNSIFKSIAVFVSRGIDIYDTSVDQKWAGPIGDGVIHDGVYRDSLTTNPSIFHGISGTDYRLPKRRDTEEIKNDIKATSIFYKLCNIELKGDGVKHDIGEKIETHTLENIETQEQLEYDDYYSFCQLKANLLYSYNSRLNLAGVERGFFHGFDFFIGWDNNNGNTFMQSKYDVYVKIETDSGDIVVHHQTDYIATKQGIWFYYPDSRATKVRIIKDKDTSSEEEILNTKLTEHPGLNGAFYFAGLPSSSGPSLDTSGGFIDGVTSRQSELLPNYIIQSEVNNPFVFRAAGYFKVGTGKILAMSSLTQALSEGQFGQFPLLVFSESGIWALTVADTGYYSSIHPISREVSNDPARVIQTDGAVFFTSEKGLMIVVGNQVKCMSEQLSGKTNSFVYSGTEQTTDLDNFIDFLRDAFIAYDYRDSLLWLFDGKTRSSVTGLTTCWVYSIKSGTFGKYDFGTGRAVTNVVNYYPDYLLQNAEGTLSLMNRPNINAEAENPNSIPYAAKIITRPMKLENALALKSIMQIKHIHDIPNLNAGTGYPSLTFKMYGSNNLTNWVELTSLRGTPWKYFRFRYDFAGLKATDRFAGTMIVTQERRTDKLR